MSDLREPIGQQFDTTFYARTTGLVGTVAYKILDNDGNEFQAATTAGITEIADGLYAARPTAPGTEGEWSVVWSKDGTFGVLTLGVDTLTTYDPGTTPATPDLPPIDTESAVGPCQAWVTAEDVAGCCGSEVGSDTDLLDEVAVIASQTLYALVPRFPGVCGPRRVRPCVTGRCGATWGVPVVWTGSRWGMASGGYDTRPNWQGCGCAGVDAIPLAGYVQEVTEVTIDGLVIDPSEYEVRRNRWLVRLNDADGNPQSWPACQDEGAAYTEDGTFSVLYTYGSPPPALGVKAAAELACAVWQTCAGSGGQATAAECALPNGVTRVVRQGITFDLDAFRSFAYDTVRKRWATGMPLVDMFLNTYNPRGRRKRRTTAVSPDIPAYPRPEAEVAS